MVANIKILITPQETSFPLPASAHIGDTIKVHVEWDTSLGGLVELDLLPPSGVDIRSFSTIPLQPAGQYSTVIDLKIVPSNALGVGHLLPKVIEIDGLQTGGMRADITILAAVTPPPVEKSSNAWKWALGVGAGFATIVAVVAGTRKK